MRQNQMLLRVTLSICVAFSILVPSCAAAPVAQGSQPTPVPFHWFTAHNASYSGFHFYTADADEAAALKTQPGWDYQGVIGYVFWLPVPGTVPLYRLGKEEFGGTNHFYTIYKDEADRAVNSLDWTAEGIAAYVSPTQVLGTTLLYRMYKPPSDSETGDVHFYTTKRELTFDYRYHNFQSVVMPAYIWTNATTVTPSSSAGVLNGLKTSSDSTAIKASGGPTPTMQEQLFNVGCGKVPGKPAEITCPSQFGYELCEDFRKKGQLKVTACHTGIDQIAFAKAQADLFGRGCSAFLGRGGEYICQTLNGDEACRNYMKQGNGLVTHCVSVKQSEMEQDLAKHGCIRFQGKSDEYQCQDSDGMKACQNYRIDGRLKACHQAK